MTRSHARGTVAALALSSAVAALVATTAQTVRPMVNVPVSEAEKRYVAPQATTLIAEGPRTATPNAGYGRKFAAETTLPLVTISNPYMDPATPLIADAKDMVCTADGGLVVGGQAGFKDGRPLGVGFWRVAPDGAVTPLHSRSVDAYALTSLTTCEAPFAKSKAAPSRFSLAADGRILFSSSASVQAVTTAGFVARVAGSPRDCANDNTKGISGYGDGGANGALFDQLDRPVEDPVGNIWVADQKGCALRKISPQGEVSTVIGRDVLCNDAVAPEDRLLLDDLTWDAAHGELVAGGARTVALPVHNLYTTIWRIKPTGEYRRVFYAWKLGRNNPAKVGVDGIRALGLDPQGRIHIVSLLMLFERRGWDALQLLRIDEAANAVVPITGTKIRNGTFLRDHPRDGPAALAWFEGTRSLCFSPDGTAFVNDDMLIRRIDPKGEVTTWLF
jgi:hypothetical protein